MALLTWGLAYHLHRRGVAVTVLAVGAAGAGALLAALGGSASGMPGPVAPPAVAALAGAFLHTAGAVAEEDRCGRASLWKLAAGGTLPWLLLDLLLRGVSLLLTTATTVVLAAAACALVDPVHALAVLAAAPFLCLMAVTLGSVGYGCSAAAPRMDILLAALYVFPGTMASAAAMARATGQPPLWTWLAVPLDALLAFAPGSGPLAVRGPGPPPALHLTLFVVAWLAVGILPGLLRRGGPPSSA